MNLEFTPTETSWVIGSSGGGSVSYGFGVKFFPGIGMIEFSLTDEATGAEVLYSGGGFGVSGGISLGKTRPVGWEYSNREHFPTRPIGHIYDERLVREKPLTYQDFEGFVLVGSAGVRLQGKLAELPGNGIPVGGGASICEMFFHRGPPIVPLFGPPTFKAFGAFWSTSIGSLAKAEVCAGIYSFYVNSVRFLRFPKKLEASIGPAGS